MKSANEKDVKRFLRGNDDDSPMTPRERALKINDHDEWQDGFDLTDLIEQAIKDVLAEDREEIAEFLLGLAANLRFLEEMSDAERAVRKGAVNRFARACADWIRNVK